MNHSYDKTPTGLPRGLQAKIVLKSNHHIGGYVYDPRNLAERFVVELILDGRPVALTRANLYDSSLLKEGVGDGCYRFAFHVDREGLVAARTAEVRLANWSEPLGPPVSIATGSERQTRPAVGCVAWSGGLRLAGWLNEVSTDPLLEVRAFVDGLCVARARAVRWTHVGDARDGIAVRGFDLYLPLEFGDGRVREAHIVDSLGRALEGSPCAFFAFRDGLAEFLAGHPEIESEQIRGRLFDQMFPQSLPFAAFAEWALRYPEVTRSVGTKVRFAVAIVGREEDVGATLASLEEQEGAAWIAGNFGEGDSQTAFSNRSLSEFLSEVAGGCDVVVFCLSGTVFRQNALVRLGQSFASFPQASLAYCDVTIMADDGQEWPIAFPSFDYERTLEQGYCSYVFAVPFKIARQAADAGANSIYRLANSTLDYGQTHKDGRLPVHVPGFLARIPRIDLSDGAAQLAQATELHLQTRRVAALVKPSSGGSLPAAWVRRRRPEGKVSLLIPIRNRSDLLKSCLDSLNRTIDLQQIELILIDNQSSERDTLDCLKTAQGKGARVVNFSGPFEFARLIGSAASVATGDFLVSLRADVEALSEDWLEEMLCRAAEPDVGAVGATLLWPSGVVRHGGFVLGVGFATGFATDERMDGDPGYSDQLLVAHDCSAVMGACLLTRRSLFRALGGFDCLRFPTDYSYIDYCLRLRASGYRVVMAPRAKLLHREPDCNRQVQPINDINRVTIELRNLRAAWGEVLLNDPYYNPMLATAGIPYSGLACPPRPFGPRASHGASRRPIPPGF